MVRALPPRLCICIHHRCLTPSGGPGADHRVCISLVDGTTVLTAACWPTDGVNAVFPPHPAAVCTSLRGGSTHKQNAHSPAGQTDQVPFTPPGAPEQVAVEAKVEANSVSPHRFKALIGRGHSEFGTPHQQDACEFFIYLMQLLERSERGAQGRLPAAASGAAPLSALFKFNVEQRTQCATTGAVSYKHLEQNVLHVDIPLEAASNSQVRRHRSSLAPARRCALRLRSSMCSGSHGWRDDCHRRAAFGHAGRLLGPRRGDAARVRK